MYNVLDSYIGKSFKLYGEYSPGEAALFADILEPGDVVVEVGAKCLYLSKVCRSQ